MVAHEVVVRQIPIAERYPVDFLKLSLRKILGGIETPAAREEALPTQDLVQACDAAGKTVANVE